MLVSTALVLLMTPALAFFYGGLVRTKNSLNTMMMSFVALGVVGVTWALAGLQPGLQRGRSRSSAASPTSDSRASGTEAKGTIPHVLFMAYQGTFAIITAALISGAVVERMRFGPYVAFIALWTLLVYAPVAHWVWGGGWLMTRGVARFRRRHRGAHQRRRVGAGRGRWCSAPGRTTGARRCCRTTCPSCCSARGCSGSAGSASTAAARSRPTSSPALAFTNTFLAPMATLVVWTLLDYFRTGRATAVGARHRDRGRAGRHHPGGGLREPDQRPAPRRPGGVPELLRHRAPLPHPDRRLARRVRRPRRGRAHRRAAHRRAGAEGLEPGRQRRPARSATRASSASRRSAASAPRSTPGS